MPHRPLRSLAYTTVLPSGPQLTKRSRSGVSVRRLVNDSPTEVTNTSPRAMKAISFPSGETAISSTPPLREMILSALSLACVVMRTASLVGLSPGCMV